MEVIEALLLLPLALWDLYQRRVPNWLAALVALAGLAADLSGWLVWSWLGLLWGLFLGGLADVPGGDFKALGIFGALSGFPSIGWVAFATLAVTLLCWRRGWLTWPWLPVLWVFFVSAKALAAVL